MSYRFHQVRGLSDIGLLVGPNLIAPAMYLSPQSAKILAMHEREERDLVARLEADLLKPEWYPER